MTTRVWTNNTGLALSAANLNALEADLATALGVPDAALAGRVAAGATQTALDGRYEKSASLDADVAAKVNSATTSTAAALRSQAAGVWKSGVAYTAGQPVINPAGDLVSAISAHTSGTSYTPANWASRNVSVRTNYCINPRGAVDASYWNASAGTGGSATVASNTGIGPDGLPNFIRYTQTTPNTGASVGPYFRDTSGGFSGSSGDVRYVTTWVKPSVSRTMYVATQYMTSGNSVVNVTQTADFSAPANVWTQSPTVTITASGAYSRFQVWPVLNRTPIVVGAGETLDVLTVISNTSGTSYFDGSTPNTGDATYWWTGTANASASVSAVGMGLGARTISVRNYATGDGVTDDTAGITKAVAAAAASGSPLNWPAGTYLTTASIPGLHTVKHSGTGVIKRGTDTFYPNPSASQSNTLYVATSGSASNDGLTAALPLNSLTNAVAALPNYGPTVGGTWTISMAAGTYTDRVTFPSGVLYDNMVTIKGAPAGHPNVPTTIFSQGYNNSAAAIIVTGLNSSITFQDILFSGYNGTSSSMGINASNHLGTVYTVNCHFTDCYYGLSSIHGLYDVKGGIFTRCGYLGDTPNTQTPVSTRNGSGAGVRSLMQARHSVGLQDAGVITNGPYFLNNRTGMFVQEGCTGHSDWVKYEDNERAIDCSVNSRVNVDGSSFKRNGMDLKGSSNSHFYIPATVAFGTGTDESDIRLALTSGAQVGDENRIFTNLLPTNATTMKVLDTQFPNRNVTATVSTVVHTVTLAGGMWRNKPNSLVSPKRINVRITGEMFGTLNNKRCIVRLGSTNVSLVFPAATVGVFEAEANIYITDRGAQTLIIRGYNHLGSLRIARSTATNDMLSDTNLTTEASVDSTGDSITIYSVDVSWGG